MHLSTLKNPLYATVCLKSNAILKVWLEGDKEDAHWVAFKIPEMFSPWHLELWLLEEVSAMNQSERNSLWRDDRWIPPWSSRFSLQHMKWCALVGIGKGLSRFQEIQQDNPSALTAASQCWLRWTLESDQRRWQPFSCTMPHSSLKAMENIASLGWTFLPHSVQIGFSAFWFPSVLADEFCAVWAVSS